MKAKIYNQSSAKEQMGEIVDEILMEQDANNQIDSLVE